MKINYENWNPWHGCTKISPGCKYCYVYRSDERRCDSTRARLLKKTANFYLPLKKTRDGQFKIPPCSFVYTCFSSDFLLEDADSLRSDCWKMMKARSDCFFFFFTKRIERFIDCLPCDWGEGYDNVIVGCTVENQDRADFRLPIFRDLPIKHKAIIVAPMLEAIELSPYLDGSIEQVGCSGESGPEARPLDYSWVLSVREQCMAKEIPFTFHQTGAKFIKDGKMYSIPRKLQISQAKKAGIDYRMGKGFLPETAMKKYNFDSEDESDSEKQLSLFG